MNRRMLVYKLLIPIPYLISVCQRWKKGRQANHSWHISSLRQTRAITFATKWTKFSRLWYLRPSLSTISAETQNSTFLVCWLGSIRNCADN